MNRWMFEMPNYRYKIEYKLRKENIVVDQLSRPVRLVHLDDNGNRLGESKGEVKEMQRAEPR